MMTGIHYERLLEQRGALLAALKLTADAVESLTEEHAVRRDYWADALSQARSAIAACECPAAASHAERRTVTIPACVEHAGHHSMQVTVPWVCLKCGGPRGEPFETLSWDGSRRLSVHGWSNPCGHLETYASVRAAIAAAETKEKGGE